MSATKLALLDTRPPVRLAELIETIEHAGFHRYWATEHYSENQSASPTVIASLAAGLSERLRVGTAGVLLALTSARRVAQDFAALEYFFPGRIDLGVVCGLPSVSVQDSFKADVDVVAGDALVDRLGRLVELLRNPQAGSPDCTLGPARTTVPEFWLCGTSRNSAMVAGRLGLRFAFHHYLARPDPPASDIEKVYRDSFRPHGADSSYFAVTAFGTCASSASAACSDWSGGRPDMPATRQPPNFLGTPRECAQSLATLADEYNADELLIDCFSNSHEARMSALAAIAGEFVV